MRGLHFLHHNPSSSCEAVSTREVVEEVELPGVFEGSWAAEVARKIRGLNVRGNAKSQKGNRRTGVGDSESESFVAMAMV